MRRARRIHASYAVQQIVRRRPSVTADTVCRRSRLRTDSRLKPDPATDYGPGFRLDYAGTAGNCATCHLPGAAIDQPFVTDPNDVTGVSAQGTHCDFCHKTRSVALDPRSGLPAIDRPGVLSMNVYVRPPAARSCSGLYDDVDGGGIPRPRRCATARSVRRAIRRPSGACPSTNRSRSGKPAVCCRRHHVPVVPYEVRRRHHKHRATPRRYRARSRHDRRIASRVRCPRRCFSLRRALMFRPCV